jgi:DNA-binding transcriptional ArsR family regulator
MKAPDIATRARAFAALGDPTRLQVFQLVSRRPLSVADIAGQLPVSRPAVSQHLRVLADAGLVACESVGTRNIYRPDSDAVESLRGFIDSLWDVGLARFRAEAESLARARALSFPARRKEHR